MTHVADHKQIETVLLDELDNARHGMTGDDMRLELDPLGLGLRASSSDDFCEAAIGFLLFFNDFVDADRQAGQFLDREVRL